MVSALMASATAPNVLAAGVAMAAFTVGTVPASLNGFIRRPGL